MQKIKQLYYEGKLEEFFEAVKELNDDSLDTKLLKLFAKTLKEGLNEKDAIIEEIKNFNNLNSEDLSTIGFIYFLLGEIDKAKEILEKAINTTPTSEYAYYRLGNIYLIETDYEKAEELINKGLDIAPKSEAYYNLGFLYKQIEKFDKALESYIKAWELKPFRYSVASKTLDAIKEYGDIDKFEEEIEEKLQKSTNKEEKSYYLAILGLIQFEKEEFNDAIIKLNKAVELNEENEELRILYTHFMLQEERYYVLGNHLVKWVEKYDKLDEHLSLAKCRIEAKFLEKAKEGLDAIEDRVTDKQLEYKLILARYYKESEKWDEAKEILEKLFEDYPAYVPVVMALSDLYNSLGEIDKSLEILENIGKDAVNVLIRRVDVKPNLEDLEKLEKYLDKVDDIDTKSSIYFGLATGYDKLKDYEKASKYIKLANELTYKKLDYSIEEFREEVDGLIDSYSSKWVKAKQNNIKFDKKPIFIVGMPRSGTTMLEQIFAAHNDVFGAGELPYIQKILRLSEKVMHKDYPKSFLYAPKRIVADGGNYYINLSKKLYDFKESIFVDKLPHNFMHSPLLVAMFKDSKVIALRRDYRSIALSNYFQNFAAKKGTLGYAFDLEAMAEHIKDYIRIMDYYKEILPSDRYREFWYEDLVLHPKEKITEVIEFCELDFTPELLEFYKNKTAVRTASVLQVRNPIYTGSTQKWKKYEDLLQPLIEIVGDAGTYKG